MPVARIIDDTIYGATYWAFVSFYSFGWRFRVTGRHHLPKTGPALIVSNHQSFLDPMLLGASATRRLTYLARSTLFENPILGRTIRQFNGVPIDRGFGKEGLQTVLTELSRGQAVVMFPEGERTHTGELQPLKPGISLLVKRVTCPIVPTAVAGVYDAWSRHQKYPRPGGKITVAFGRPIDPARYKGMDREALLTDLFNEIKAVYEVAERMRQRG